MTEFPDDKTSGEESEEEAPPRAPEDKSAERDQEVGPDEAPIAGGYKHRDPKTEMPIMPGRPETAEEKPEDGE